MGGIKPIGSEKLQGMDKINRIMEIARYNENIPKSVNEDTSVEYKITLADGNTYRIDKEKNGYVIKKGLNESYDYMEPMKNRKYYSSYSQAFKRLNLIAKEVNVNEGYDKNVSLFNESDDTKYYLKLNNGGEVEEQPASPAAAPAPAPAPVPAPVPSPAPAPEGGEMPDMGGEDMGMEEPEGEEDFDMEEPEDEDEDVVTFKTIQKLTGKLGQKIRAFLSDEENEMTSKDIKYVINSVLSALELDNLDEEDKEDILDKLEGVGEEDFDMEEPEMDDEEGEELSPETPEVPEPEMAESFDFDDDMESDDEDDMEFKPRGARRRRIHHDDLTDDESYHVEDMFEEIFSESKIDKVLNKYFGEEPTKKVIKESVSKKETMFTKIQKLSESKSQEAASAKVMSKYPTAKLVGKTPNKDLVFEVEDKKLKISTKGGYKLL